MDQQGHFTPEQTTELACEKGGQVFVLSSVLLLALSLHHRFHYGNGVGGFGPWH